MTAVTPGSASGGYTHGMAKPVLWHIPISHYAEKVRWALKYKEVEHVRRALPPPSHMAIAAALTRGRSITIPVLSLDGRHIGDSTAIIAALEERYPEPPLYPAGPAERARALELEEFFDEELGPHVRQATFNELRSEPETFQRLAGTGAPGPVRLLGPALGAYAKAYTALRWRAGDDDAAERSRAKVHAAVDRLEAELGDGDYLVGDAFSVADLTAASLLYPVVLSPGAPIERGALPRPPRLLEELTGRRAVEWADEMYRRHRGRRSRAAAAA